MIIICEKCDCKYNGETVNQCPKCVGGKSKPSILDPKNVKKECVVCGYKLFEDKERYIRHGNYCTDCSARANTLAKIKGEVATCERSISELPKRIGTSKEYFGDIKEFGFLEKKQSHEGLSKGEKRKLAIIASRMLDGKAVKSDKYRLEEAKRELPLTVGKLEVLIFQCPQYFRGELCLS